MSESLDDHVAFVTGASRGIGRQTALALAEAGCDLALAARTLGDLEQTASLCRRHGAATTVCETDVADRSSVRTAVGKAVDVFGRLDILVNNAGRDHRESVSTADLDEWEATVEVNLLGTLYATRYAAPHIERAVEHGRRGAIVNIASIAGVMSFEDGGAYCSSKHGVVGLTGSTFEDLRETGIKVSTIEPGFVDTDFVGSENLNRDKMIRPEDVAQTVVFVATFPDTGCPTEIELRPQRTPYE